MTNNYHLSNLCSSRFFQVGYQVRTILLFLQTCKNHFSAWDIFFRIREVFIQCIITPSDSLVLVCLGVREARSLPCLSTYQTAQVWTLLVLATCFHSMTLRTCLGKDLLASCSVTHYLISCRSELS